MKKWTENRIEKIIKTICNITNNLWFSVPSSYQHLKNTEVIILFSNVKLKLIEANDFIFLKNLFSSPQVYHLWPSASIDYPSLFSLSPHEAPTTS